MNRLCLAVCIFICFPCHAFTLAPGEIRVDGKPVAGIEFIDSFIQRNSLVLIGPGVYYQGFSIDHDDVTIIAREAHFKDAAIQGKAAFVVNGDNVSLVGIECSEISVADNNGACVRQQGQNLILRDVYFHHSQQGILQASGTGKLSIISSHFEHLGKNGRAHAVYANGSELIIIGSQFIDSKDQGHGIKSRSPLVHIIDSVISSGSGNDSRLVDMSHGGRLLIENSVLHQGINTVNNQLIGFALEKQLKLANQIIIKDSIILAERPRGNRLLLLPKRLSKKVDIQIDNNVFIGKYKDQSLFDSANNHLYRTRIAADIKTKQLPDISMHSFLFNGGLND